MASAFRTVPWLLLAAGCAGLRSAPPDQLPAVAFDVIPFVERQLREQGIPGAAVAVVDVRDGSARHWQQGFGRLRPDGPAMPHDAVFRVASVSKLFTAVAAMRLVERGELDLDRPVRELVPECAPANAFGREPTVRDLLRHEAGVVRESPVGHYFDASEPDLAATVASLADTELVHAPGSAFKYSNPGFGVVGEIVARVRRQPFEQAARDLVLTPLGLRDSDFAAAPRLRARQAGGVMWTYDGRDIPTPDFAFGYGPAANLRSTVGDLAAFARSWLPGARARVLRRESLEAMWALPAGQERGCGLGFFVQRMDGARMVGHDGAVYGFATALRALPDDGLAVAVVCTKDFANEVAEAIAVRALRAAQAARQGRALPPPDHPTPLGRDAARELAGRYRVGPHWVDLKERGGDLYYDPNIGVRTRLRRAADGVLVSDDPLSLGGRRLTRRADGTLFDGQEDYVRDDAMPAAPPAELLPLLGEYGFDHNVLVVYEDGGRLGVLIEWVVRDLPERVGPDHYVFPPGMYGGDALRFERDANGAVVAARVGGARFPRRPDPVPGAFRIAPRRPVDEVIAEARRAQPDARLTESQGAKPFRPFDLVPLPALDPTLRFQLVYATSDNFLGAPVYPPDAQAKLQRAAAEALLRVHWRLRQQGLGLWIFDAYRPWWVTKAFWDATPDAMRHFVADPQNGSRHNRGCAVDLTLYDLATGQPVEMPSGFDEFTPRAYPDYPGGTARQRHCREALRRAMETEGFTVYEHEWWHFDFPGWQDFAIGNEPL
jgi:CubicO group peptidase (beta-lactamase class C family)/D-alanyl-D-alanine dipeptidase